MHFLQKFLFEQNYFQNLQRFDGSTKNSVLMIDNLIVHHCEPIISLLKDMGIVVQFLPPYSPDFNPTKEAFSKIPFEPT